jgi:PTH1 family peptidyl-tRNA hydrolase
MDIKYIFIKTKEDNTDCMNKFLIVGLGNIGAEYVHAIILDSKYWIILPKEQLSFQTVKLGALAEYKFKGRTFFLI